MFLIPSTLLDILQGLVRPQPLVTPQQCPHQALCACVWAAPLYNTRSLIFPVKILYLFEQNHYHFLIPFWAEVVLSLSEFFQVYFSWYF